MKQLLQKSSDVAAVQIIFELLFADGFLYAIIRTGLSMSATDTQPDISRIFFGSNRHVSEGKFCVAHVRADCE